jgi:hypothetical protein
MRIEWNHGANVTSADFVTDSGNNLERLAQRLADAIPPRAT